MNGDDLRREQLALYAGEYHALSGVLAPAAGELVRAAGIAPGSRVLDVAAGDGNVAVEAAALGADVVASDLSPVQVERGRARTRAAGLDVEWLVADAERLPFADGSFDAVMSAFGAVAAPDPERAAAELCRVARAGGVVALTAWPADAFMGRVAAAVRERLPSFADPEHGWGEEATARRYLAPHAEVIRCERSSLSIDPAARGAAGAADCAARYLAERLPAEDATAIRSAVAPAFVQPDGTLRADYLLVLARVR